MTDNMKYGYDSNLKDKFLRGKLIINSPVSLFILLVAYLLFVKKIGPAWMKNKPAFNLREVIIVYNVIQVLYSGYIVYLGISLLRNHGLFDRGCTAFSEPFIENTLFAGYCYLLAKIIELLDTVFFVLRKKQSQVTFLHVYHHATMVTISWLGLLYDISFGIAFAGTLNSLVHVVMYSYYCLSAIPALKRYLWWKKFLTSLQLIQFAVICIQMILFKMITKCCHSYFLVYSIIANVFIVSYFFINFYINSYIKQKNNNLVTKNRHKQ